MFFVSCSNQSYPMQKLTDFYLNHNEPIKGCLLALREIILKQDPEISTEMKYGMPFFCYKGKMFCYLWVHKKYQQPYLGMVEGNHLNHPNLLIEKRSRMKIMLFNSFDFLIFFPLITLLYFVLPHKFRWAMLLAASCIFYMYFIPKYILILFLTHHNAVSIFAWIYIAIYYFKLTLSAIIA